MKQQKYDIFISYRRKTGVDDARLLQQSLKARGYKVFFDYDSLRDGKFDERIYAAIEEAPIFILLLSEGSLDTCYKEDDWVRIEIEHAMKHECKIIPVAVDPAHWAFPNNLPTIISCIVRVQISELNKAALFEESIDRIVNDRFPESLKNVMRFKKVDISETYDWYDKLPVLGKVFAYFKLFFAEFLLALPYLYVKAFDVSISACVAWLFYVPGLVLLLGLRRVKLFLLFIKQLVVNGRIECNLGLAILDVVRIAFGSVFWWCVLGCMLQCMVDWIDLSFWLAGEELNLYQVIPFCMGSKPWEDIVLIGMMVGLWRLLTLLLLYRRIRTSKETAWRWFGIIVLPIIVFYCFRGSDSFGEWRRQVRKDIVIFNIVKAYDKANYAEFWRLVDDVDDKNSKILLRLGEAYFNGIGLNAPDYRKARRYYKKLLKVGDSRYLKQAENGLIRAEEALKKQNERSELKSKTEEVFSAFKEKNYEFFWDNIKDADKEDIVIIACLGDAYYYGYGLSQKDYSKAAVQYEKLRLKLTGIKRANVEYQLACCFWNVENYTKAVEWARSAISGENLEAWLLIGSYTELGLGGNKINLEEAKECYEKALTSSNAIIKKTAKDGIERVMAKIRVKQFGDKEDSKGFNCNKIYDSELASRSARIKANQEEEKIEFTTHIVQRGDTLSKISQRYDINVDAIVANNPHIKNYVVRLGQKIKLPGKVNVGRQVVASTRKETAELIKEAHAAFVQNNWKIGFDIATNISMNAISDSYVTYHVGYCYSPTYGTDYPKEKDYEKAYEWFKQTAELEQKSGDGIVQCILGDMEMNGHGCATNIDNAVAWYRMSAEREYGRGCYELGKCYEDNIVEDTNDNLVAATNWYFKAKELKYDRAKEAYERVGTKITERESAPKIIWNYDTDKKKWEYDHSLLSRFAIFLKENPDKYVYVIVFMSGEGMMKISNLKLFAIVNELLDLGVPADKIIASYQVEDVIVSVGSYNLGGFTELIVKEKVPDSASVKGSRLVVGSAHDWRSKFHFAKGADLYENKNYKDFVEYVKSKKVYFSDDPLISFLMAECYDQGKGGVVKNNYLAFKWYLKSAENGMAVSQARVGVCYKHGIGTDVNYDKAFYWIKKSASQNYATGCYLLGEFLENGVGVDKNLKLAIKNYQKAAELGNDSAKTRLQALGLIIK